MYRGNNTKVLPVIIAIIVIALIVTAIVSAIQTLVGRSDDDSLPEVDIAESTLLDTSGSGSVRMTVRGPLVSNEDFRSYRVIVSPSSRSLTTYRGYLDQTIESKQYDNNAKAYDEFVHALNKANMIRGEELVGEKNDTRGTCATGKVTEFEVVESSNVVKRLWTSTCKGSPGSLKASVKQIYTLFINQIPDYKEALDNIDAV